MFLVNLLFYLSSGISQGRLMNFCKALQLLMIPLISNTVVKHLHMYSTQCAKNKLLLSCKLWINNLKLHFSHPWSDKEKIIPPLLVQLKFLEELPCSGLGFDPLYSQKTDGARSQGKGCRVCLGGRFCSIPCCAIYFSSVYLEETVPFNLFFQIDRGKTASAAKKFDKFCPPKSRNDLCLGFGPHYSSMHVQ